MMNAIEGRVIFMCNNCGCRRKRDCDCDDCRRNRKRDDDDDKCRKW